MEQNKEAFYDVRTDEKYKEPYVDIDEWKEESVRYHYIHGGFEGTTLKFSFYFPDKDVYEGRFFQFLSPVPGSEDASMGRKGMEDKIAFAITHGAYFVESNMGEFDSEPVMKFQGSAAAAEYSREVAKKLYGEHRPYGYVYGGSGGGYKTMSCIENTDHVWDGAVPYIIGTPYSAPNDFMIRAHCMRILKINGQVS